MAKTPARSGPRPSKAKRERARRVYDKLAAVFPDARCALDYRNPFELLVATILSAQCTDKRVNMVTPALFARYPDAHAMAKADPEDVETLIHSTGFYRAKAKSLIGASQRLVAEHGGEVPQAMDALLMLPGVARKTANVVLGNAFGINVGVVVDTHIRRLSNRLGFTRHQDPTRIERDLMALFPDADWTLLAHLLILHGRATCVARKPRCSVCPVAEDCPKLI